jgi:DNA-binding transcriptional MerR regulator
METRRPQGASDDDLELTLDELAQRVNVPTRTIRFYIAQGLLPGPGTRGKSASYGAEHLVRLRLIRLLTARHLPLAEVQALLADLALEDARALLAAEEERTDQLRAAEKRQSPRDYVSALLDEARQGRQEPPPRKLDSYAPKNLPAPAPGTVVAPKGAASWARIVLAPGVELHVRADVGRPEHELIRRLLRAAGALPAEDDEAGDQ